MRLLRAAEGGLNILGTGDGNRSEIRDLCTIREENKKEGGRTRKNLERPPETRLLTHRHEVSSTRGGNSDRIVGKDNSGKIEKEAPTSLFYGSRSGETKN